MIQLIHMQIFVRWINEGLLNGMYIYCKRVTLSYLENKKWLPSSPDSHVRFSPSLFFFFIFLFFFPFNRKAFSWSTNFLTILYRLVLRYTFNRQSHATRCRLQVPFTVTKWRFFVSWLTKRQLLDLIAPFFIFHPKHTVLWTVSN